MTFVSGARITEKRHNSAGWRSWLSKQMSLQPPLKRVQWQAAVTQYWWHSVTHCGSVEGEAALDHRRLYSWQVDTSSIPVDTDRSRGRPWTFSPGMQNSCRYGGATPWMHFDTRTAVLKMILRRTGSQLRLRRTGVMYRPSPAVVLRTLTEPQYSVLIEAVLFECQLFLPAEHCNSPTDNV